MRESLNCESLNREWTWKDKLRSKLFPRQHCDLPDAPPTYKDVLVCKVVCQLPILERLKLLLSGRFFVEIRTVTENELGRHVTATVGYVLPPEFIDR